MDIQKLVTGERIMIVDIKGDRTFKNFLLSNGVAVGSVLIKNYSPFYSKLTNFTIGAKMLSLRTADFANIEFVKM